MNEENQHIIFFAAYIFLILIAALLVTYIISNVYNQDQEKHEMVCQNLEKVIHDKVTKDEFLKVFPEIYSMQNHITKTTEYRVVEVFGKTVEPWRWDDDGVSCQIDIELCNWKMTYCIDGIMLVPVNYTIWEEWYNE